MTRYKHITPLGNVCEDVLSVPLEAAIVGYASAPRDQLGQIGPWDDASTPRTARPVRFAPRRPATQRCDCHQLDRTCSACAEYLHDRAELEAVAARVAIAELEAKRATTTTPPYGLRDFARTFARIQKGGR